MRAYASPIVVLLAAALVILPATLVRGVDGLILAAIPFCWGFWVAWTMGQRGNHQDALRCGNGSDTGA